MNDIDIASTPSESNPLYALAIFIPIIGGFLAAIVVGVIPFWVIFKKAGFHPALSILTIIPFVNFIVFYIVAFSKWNVSANSPIPPSPPQNPPRIS